jgi:hypothetical protein
VLLHASRGKGQALVDKLDYEAALADISASAITLCNSLDTTERTWRRHLQLMSSFAKSSMSANVAGTSPACIGSISLMASRPSAFSIAPLRPLRDDRSDTPLRDRHRSGPPLRDRHRSAPLRDHRSGTGPPLRSTAQEHRSGTVHVVWTPPLSTAQGQCTLFGHRDRSGTVHVVWTPLRETAQGQCTLFGHRSGTPLRDSARCLETSVVRVWAENVAN